MSVHFRQQNVCGLFGTAALASAAVRKLSSWNTSGVEHLIYTLSIPRNVWKGYLIRVMVSCYQHLKGERTEGTCASFFVFLYFFIMQLLFVVLLASVFMLKLSGVCVCVCVCACVRACVRACLCLFLFCFFPLFFFFFFCYPEFEFLGAKPYC